MRGVEPDRGAGLEAVLAVAAHLERVHVARDVHDRRAAKGLPLNPDGIANMEPTLAFNTISSFTTNTNLQHYSGETGLSYLSQMFVITFLQFVTAATGMAAASRPFAASAATGSTTLGNFYVDLTRATFRVFLPLALLVSVILMSQGTPKTFEGAAQATTLEGPGADDRPGRDRRRRVHQAAGHERRRVLRAELRPSVQNPTPLSNLVETWSITLIPMAMVLTLGVMVAGRSFAVVIS